MNLKSHRTVIYMVVSDVRGGEINSWIPCKTLAQAKKERKVMIDFNHNGWNYPIVKQITTTIYQLKTIV